jgi:hypothetical protein
MENWFRRVTEVGYFFFPTIKVVAGYPIYPVTGRDTAKSGIGLLEITT